MRVKRYLVERIDKNTSVEKLEITDSVMEAAGEPAMVLTKKWERDSSKVYSRNKDFCEQIQEYLDERDYDEKFLNYIYDEYDNLWLGSSILGK